ncbi:MAG TPA: hypothetical protein VFR85_18190 [Anaeromyxobacteraceae bacterium]|nr:hypothetical protein [Anaeromyxobacteraceae bacterium]
MRTPAWLLVAAACASGPKPPPPGAAPADYFPLAVGNEWVYQDLSPQLDPKAREASRRTVRILSRAADGYFLDNEKGALRADPDCLHDRMRRLLCKPFEPGRSWTSVVSVSSIERYEIAAVGEEARTAAGTFRGCIRVRAHNRAGADADNMLEITYAPGVGPVRIETFAVVKGAVTPQVKAELLSYRLQPR